MRPAEGVVIPGQKLWPTVGKLLRLQLLITWGSFRRAKISRKLGITFGVVGVMVFIGFITFLSFALLRVLLSPQLAEIAGDLRPILSSMPVSITAAAFVGVLLTSFGLLLQALYLAGDMDFLLSAPVQIRAVFITKMMQAVLPNFVLILLFSLPVLFGLAAALNYHWLFYPLLIVSMIAMALAASGLSGLLVMLAVRVFPARRVAEVLGMVVGISSFICSQSGQIFNWVDVESVQLASGLQMVNRFNTPWSPLAWVGRGLVAIGEQRWGMGLLQLAVSIGLSLGLFYLALTTSERLYYSGWASMQVQIRRKKTTRPAAQRTTGINIQWQRFVPSPVRAVMLKDFRMMRRDLRNMSQLITPLILGLVYSVWFLRGGDDAFVGRGEAPDWFMFAARQAAVYGNVGISVFISWMLLIRLGLLSFAQEGKSYWIIKSAPLRIFHLIAAKFFVAYLPTVILGLLFMIVTAVLKGVSLAVFGFGLAVIIFSTAGMTGLNLGLGISGAVLNWDDPRHMVNTASGCLSPLLSFLYAGIALGLFFIPPIVFLALQLPEWAGQLIGLLLGGAFSLAVTYGAPWFARRKLARLGEGI